MIELIKRYPLWSVIIGLIFLGGISNVCYDKWQAGQVQLTKLQQTSVEGSSSVQKEQGDMPSDVQIKEAKAATAEQEVLQKTEEQPAVSPAAPSQVPVYICGEVQRPGVYYVAADAIINEVVRKSGGFTEKADVLAVNLASPIMANEKIIIPKQGEKIDKLIESYDNIEGNEEIERKSITSIGENRSENTCESGYEDQAKKININTASEQQLMTLPGIGEVKAAAIVAYRQEHGVFTSKEALKNVSGIGDKTYLKLAQLITIE